MGNRSSVYIIALALGLMAADAKASYRVYQLKLRHYDQTAKKKINQIVLSALDPVQYESFHGGPGVMKVELLDTWYCPGDTSRKNYCKKPKGAAERAPASLDHPKRNKLPYNLQPVIP